MTAPLDRSPAGYVLALLRDPQRAHSLDLLDWDGAVRTARSWRLLGVLHAALMRAGVLDSLPDEPRRHLDSDFRVACFQAQAARYQMRHLATLLAPIAPVIALKGCAYIIQDLPMSAGRVTSDVDLMVPRERLDAAEKLVRDAGWEYGEIDPHDEHYYRHWVHELPPMRCHGYYLELDLHHTILPLTGTLQPDAAALAADSRHVEGSPFRVLSPADQVLHACAHLAQDSDFTGRMRDLVDVHGLIVDHADGINFWDELLARAALHQLGRPLWYALRYAERWLGSPVPDAARSALARWAPSPGVTLAMDALVARALFTRGAELAPTPFERAARNVLWWRSHLLRMPPSVLVRHAAVKWLRRIVPARPLADPA